MSPSVPPITASAIIPYHSTHIFNYINKSTHSSLIKHPINPSHPLNPPPNKELLSELSTSLLPTFTTPYQPSHPISPPQPYQTGATTHPPIGAFHLPRARKKGHGGRQTPRLPGRVRGRRRNPPSQSIRRLVGCVGRNTT